jgi:hypothetical protein
MAISCKCIGRPTCYLYLVRNLLQVLNAWVMLVLGYYPTYTSECTVLAVLATLVSFHHT